MTLVNPLFDGPLDLVGDVHGEIDALTDLLRQLEYDADGDHAEKRRLVFVGDLVDRGPDSPAVFVLVRRLIERQRAQCVLGNHELNILLGSRKIDNTWFFHHELLAGHPAANRPQVRADERMRAAMLRFFAALPLALERPDLRIVHACWDEGKIADARRANQTDKLYHDARTIVEERLRRGEFADRKVAHQNENPVKLLTSGPEEKAEAPFQANGQWREERRLAWWREYSGPLCVFGHYSRLLLPGEGDHDRLFADSPPNATLGRGDALCIDFSAGKRFKERLAPGFKRTFQTRLAALRLPERMLIFDDGQRQPILAGRAIER